MVDYRGGERLLVLEEVRGIDEMEDEVEKEEGEFMRSVVEEGKIVDDIDLSLRFEEVMREKGGGGMGVRYMRMWWVVVGMIMEWGCVLSGGDWKR